ncbi:MAG: ABC transporter permease [Thermoanaerobaculia bacterium]
MRISPTMLVAKREYVTRIQTKAFWITTLLMPLLMGALVFLPSLILMKSSAKLSLAIVDETGKVGAKIGERLKGNGEGKPDAAKGARRRGADQRTEFVVEVRDAAADRVAQRAALDQEVLGGKLDAWVWVPATGLADSKVEYHATSVSNFITQSVLEGALTDVMSATRLADAGIDQVRVAELTHRVDLETIRVSKEGSRAEAGMAGFFLAYLLFFLLYAIMMAYGQQVMTGVLEEKTSRIVEVMISTVRPFELMLGKLAGIGAVGLTQLLLWLGTMAVLTTPAAIGAIVSLPEEFHLPQISLGVVLHFLALFVLGFFLYASFYAAIGAACNDMREAQQLASAGVMFLVAPVLFMMPVINAPDSPLAVSLSLVPPLTPLLMLLRIAVKTPPVWQLALGYLMTGGFTLFMVWVCARIYRVGILMYGKRPTVPEMLRWVRHA